MIEQTIILSLVSIGICCTMWSDMVFEKLGDKIEATVGEFWAKPLGKCYVCTTFWISLLTCAIAGWPIWLSVPAMGLSAAISLFTND